MFNPFENFQDTMQKLNQFTQSCGVTENQAQGIVQQKLNSGEMSQGQLNTIIPIAQQMYMMMHGGRR
jgi:hypothetical protein